ncbi:HD domain-containing protein [Microbacterium sp. A1-JK]|uniref:HD domain-containing protein n=1 Tax=Microbacterium sp. A1-JK TaxID=3177516 RepID=UPI003889E54D
MELLTSAEQRAVLAQVYPAFSALSLSHVRTEVAEALTQFGKFGLLEEYTKHDISHIDSMLKMYDWLIPEDASARMTAADWLLITLATYLHDFGLMVTRDEYDNRENFDGYTSFVRRVRDYGDPEYADYRAQLDAMPGADADKFLYQEFVRANHAKRIRSWLHESPDPSLGFDKRIVEALRKIFGGIEETFLDDLGLVCESHHSDDLDDVGKYRIDKPYGQDPQEEANVQYAAFLLRTADLLDISQSRVPSMSALVINPRNPKSQLEWAKQAAVKRVRARRVAVEDGEVAPDPDVIEVHAAFKDSEGFFGLTQYLKYASEQVALTHRWAAASLAAGADGYVFPWKRIDSSNVVAKGFIAEPYEFTIDQGKILDLLTGHTLYNDSGVVVRELLQNSLDAVRLQGFLGSTPEFHPLVEISWNSTERVLTVADNGTGMTQSVIENNFLRVGSSRYQDPEFRKTHPDFASISRFGIGVLTAFMVADDVQVITVNEDEAQARQLTLRDVHGQYLVRLLEKTSAQVPELLRKHGTSVRLKLRSSASLDDLEAVLGYWCLQPDCAVTLSVDGGTPVPIGFDSMASALQSALISSAQIRTSESGFVNTWGDQVEIRHSVGDGYEVAYAVAWSRWLQEWSFLRVDLDRSGSRPSLILGTAIGGVRVTDAAPGFKIASGVAAMANVTGKHAPRTNVARSAIERTDEYDRYLDRVYSAYIGHIDGEMKNLESDRKNSATRAATEGNYLVQEIANVPALESESRFRASVMRLPFILVEQGGGRERRSLEDLESVESVWTVEGTSVSDFERVLGTIRGASSVSLTSLTGALGISESMRLPNGVMVCGLQPSGGYRGRLFAAGWDPVKFETDDESRILRALWTRNLGNPRWTIIRTPKGLPSALSERMELLARIGGGASGDVCLPAGSDATSDGIEESVIKCQGRFYVLPGSPLLEIEAASENVPSEHRSWAIALLVTNVLVDTPGAASAAMRLLGRASGNAATQESLLTGLRELSLYEILDEASVLHAFTLAATRVLNVDQWDRRARDQE